MRDADFFVLRDRVYSLEGAVDRLEKRLAQLEGAKGQPTSGTIDLKMWSDPGWDAVRANVAAGAPKSEAQTCPKCEGRGGESDVSCSGKDCSWCCPACNGTGKVGGGK